MSWFHSTDDEPLSLAWDLIHNGLINEVIQRISCHCRCTCNLQVASLASATFMCALGREQQYLLNAKGQIWDQPRSAICLARASLMASALARRRVSLSSRDFLARASLMASALARCRVSPSSRDSLAQASLMVSVLARRRVSLSSGDSLARARLCKHAIDPTLPCRRGLPYRTSRPYVNMVTSHRPTLTHTHARNFVV